jgi:hypothetical protein
MHRSLNKDAPFHRAIERLGAITSYPISAAFTTDIAESNFRYTQVPMASPATIYFAGIATVVAAVGVGFGGAFVFTDTKPVHKEGPAAFAKRDQPVAVETPVVAPVITSAAQQAPVAPSMPDLIPAPATTAEKVVALDYAPPQPTPAQFPLIQYQSRLPYYRSQLWRRTLRRTFKRPRLRRNQCTGSLRKRRKESSDPCCEVRGAETLC